MSMRSAQRGIAFIVVIWVMVLLTVLLAGFAVIARTEALQARHLAESTRARYMAEAGISRAVWELRNPDPLTRWAGDGRSYEFEFEGAKISVAIQDESGKIDLNAVDGAVFMRYLEGRGVDGQRAQQIADALMDWRDADDLTQPMGAEDADYEREGYPYGAADNGFQTVGELQQVMGMDYELFRQLEPDLTIWGGNSMPSAGAASLAVLMSFPGMTPQMAEQLIALRSQMQPGDPAAATLTLPDGTPMLTAGGGVTYTVRSKATLPNGAWTQVDATIRLGGAAGARAYTILQWREGSAG
jgi:general secretion pathway protein K